MSYGLAILQKSSKNGTCLSSLIVYRAKKMTLSLKRVGILGNWGNQILIPPREGLIYSLAFYPRTYGGGEGYPAQKRRKNEENH